MIDEANLFLREFVRSPARTGAIAPSSTRLSTAMVAPIPAIGDPVVVELGPGTGSFTREIQRRLNGRGRHIAIELSPRLAGVIAERFPGVDSVTGDAAALPGIFGRYGLERADVVISGLPWAMFPTRKQRSILDAISQVLAPAGAFTTFAYIHAHRMPRAVRFRRFLEATFEEVVPGRTVWRNLPPAFVYHARRLR